MSVEYDGPEAKDKLIKSIFGWQTVQGDESVYQLPAEVSEEIDRRLEDRIADVVQMLGVEAGRTSEVAEYIRAAACLVLLREHRCGLAKSRATVRRGLLRLKRGLDESLDAMTELAASGPDAFDQIRSEAALLIEPMLQLLERTHEALSALPAKGKGDGTPFVSTTSHRHFVLLAYGLWCCWSKTTPSFDKEGEIAQLTAIIYEIATGKDSPSFAKALRIYSRQIRTPDP
jgi:hypothetical protein